MKYLLLALTLTACSESEPMIAQISMPSPILVSCSFGSGELLVEETDAVFTDRKTGMIYFKNKAGSAFAANTDCVLISKPLEQ